MLKLYQSSLYSDESFSKILVLTLIFNLNGKMSRNNSIPRTAGCAYYKFQNAIFEHKVRTDLVSLCLLSFSWNSFIYLL